VALISSVVTPCFLVAGRGGEVGARGRDVGKW